MKTIPESYEAFTKGCFFPSDASDIKILSIHDKALNFIIYNELVISIVGCFEDMTSLSAVVPGFISSLKSNSWRHSIIRSQEKITLVNDKLSLSFISIDFSQVSCLDLSVEKFVASAVMLPDINLLKQIFHQIGHPEGLIFQRIEHGECISDPFNMQVRNLLKEVQLEQRNENILLHGLSRLIGLGRGFTPSGDDFITGSLCAEKFMNTRRLSTGSDCGGGKEKRRYSLMIDHDELFCHLSRTTLPGKTLLWQALHGQFPYYLLNSITLLQKAHSHAMISDILHAAISHGETSGTDTLAGFFWFLELGSQNIPRLS